MVLANNTSENIRELSKREKIFGLGKVTWIFLIFVFAILINWIPILITFISFLVCLILAYIAEFFDDAIFLILFQRFVIYPNTNQSVFYP